jgi:hypothetical protein
MQIHCPNCDTPIPANGINIQDKLAVCPQCSSVFSFADLPLRQRKERKVKAPEGMTVTENPDSLEIQFPWLRMAGKTGMMLAGIFTLCLLFPGAAAVALIATAHSIAPVFWGVALGLLALFLGYPAAIILLDRARLMIDDEAIRVEYKPVPAGHKVHAERGEIERVYCALPPGQVVGRGQGYYGVWAVYRDGREVLLTTLRREWAMYIAQTLDTYLQAEPEIEGAADEIEEAPPVEDEMPVHTLSASR